MVIQGGRIMTKITLVKAEVLAKINAISIEIGEAIGADPVLVSMAIEAAIKHALENKSFAKSRGRYANEVIEKMVTYQEK
jgi:hypothetical protein